VHDRPRSIEIPAGLPYDPFRETLYTVAELTDGGLDARIERHVLEHGFRAPPAAEALAQRLHDHAIDLALAGLLADRSRQVVGVMGSAVTPRDDPWYRATAELGRLLTRAGFLVATGGGPGVMEAANLGAALARHPDAALDTALERIAAVPGYEGDAADYVAAAAEVREQFGERADSLAIPTWFYPGEPVGQFASHVAKYFANSIREDGLLSIAVAGIVYAPGRAGTTQELFQDAAQNAYGIRGRSPMVLLGRDAYDRDPSLYAVLRDQARRFGGYERLVALCETPAEAVAFIEANQPVEAVEAVPDDPAAIVRFVRNERTRAR
jgi:predicted Rossmann-fold nucleotide-binding protein